MRKSFCHLKLFVSMIFAWMLLFDFQSVFAQNVELIDVVELSITSEPESDADVYVDGVFVGKTPLLWKITAGKHHVIVKKYMYYEYDEEIEITDERTHINVKMNPKYGFAKINTQPMGATVFIDGIKSKSLTSLISDRLIAGNHALLLHLNGYLDVDTVISVSENNMTVLNIKLERQLTVKNNLDLGGQNESLVANGIVTDNNVARVKAEKVKRQNKINGDSKQVATLKDKLVHGLWIKAGSGLSHVWGKDVGSWSTGDYYSIYPTFYAGLQYTLDFNRFVGVGAELSYSKTGYQHMYKINDAGEKVIEKYDFNGVDLPVTARFHFMKGGVGPVVELGVLVNFKKNYNLKRTFQNGNTEKAQYRYNAFNYGCVVGLGGDFRIGTVMCTANARAVMEMSNIFENKNHKMVYFQIGLGVNIF